MEELFIELLKEYGYIILFIWSILEGELGLITAGLLVHTGDMDLYLSIFVAGLGGFAGDQIYFYIGRYGKKTIQTKLKSQRRKFALARILLKKYGWSIVFVQRYMYGLRTILPMAIGTTGFSSKKFAIINFISAILWASITIIPVYIFGEEILEILAFFREHWYLALIMAMAFLIAVSVYFHKKTKKQKKGEHL